jgi:hypothetical protein
MLDALKPGFESGVLKPYDLQTCPLSNAIDAYEAVAKGGPLKHVLLPNA